MVYLPTMEMDNKNPRQVYFNQVKGAISELNDCGEYCSVTLSCGHENPRLVNLVTKKAQFTKVKEKHAVGDRVSCRFYLASNKKHERWHTSAILLEISFD